MANSMPLQEALFKASKSLVFASACLAFQSACANNRPGPNEAVIAKEIAPFASFVSINTPSRLIDIESSNGSYFAMSGDTGAKLYECDQALYRLCLFSKAQKIALFIPFEAPESGGSWRFKDMYFSVALKYRNIAIIDVKFGESDTEVFRYVLDGDKIIGLAWGDYTADACTRCFQARITYFAAQ